MVYSGTLAEKRSKGTEQVRKWRAAHPETERRWQRERANRKAMYVHEYKALMGCMDCGETDPVVLELDHINPEEKVRNRRGLMTGKGVTVWRKLSWEALDLELVKCRVLCANCHRRRTATQLGWYKFRPESSTT